MVGDLNDTPISVPLAPLLMKTDLKDVADAPELQPSDGRAGTYGNGTASQKIDYVLLSPALFAAVTAGAIYRMGVWGGKQRHAVPALPDDDGGGARGVGPRGDLRGHQPLTAARGVAGPGPANRSGPDGFRDRS